MRKLILSVLLLPALAFSQGPVKVNKELYCDETKRLISAVRSNYNEQLFWAGQDDASKYALLSNKDTGSWTLIQFNEQIACILGVGDKHTPAKSFTKIKT